MSLYASVVLGLYASSGLAGYINKRQASATGPVDPTTIKDCTYWELAGAGSSCASVEGIWGLSHADFVKYNPSVKDDCSGWKIGNSYCVEENFGNGPASPTTTTTKPPPPATTTAVPLPSPTQAGLIATCQKFYKVASGDTCAVIVAKYGTFTVQEFETWNPAVGTDCKGLWLDYYVCVGIPGTPTTKPAALPATTTKPAAGGAPSPTQPGIVATCNAFYLVKSGDSCATIVAKYGSFTLANFYAWNPAVGTTCANLWLDYYVCVGTPSQPTKAPTKTPTPTPTPSPSTPTPLMPGTISTCKKFYKVVSGDICAKIESTYKITADQFNKWNPNVGTTCAGLWLDYYVCVGI